MMFKYGDRVQIDDHEVALSYFARLELDVPEYGIVRSEQYKYAGLQTVDVDWYRADGTLIRAAPAMVTAIRLSPLSLVESEV